MVRRKESGDVSSIVRTRVLGRYFFLIFCLSERGIDFGNLLTGGFEPEAL